MRRIRLKTIIKSFKLTFAQWDWFRKLTQGVGETLSLTDAIVEGLELVCEKRGIRKPVPPDQVGQTFLFEHKEGVDVEAKIKETFPDATWTKGRTFGNVREAPAPIADPPASPARARTKPRPTSAAKAKSPFARKYPSPRPRAKPSGDPRPKRKPIVAAKAQKGAKRAKA